MTIDRLPTQQPERGVVLGVVAAPARRPKRNLPHLIKWIILILLVVLLVVQLTSYSGEYRQLLERQGASWLILLLELLLIAIVVWLMRVQRRQVRPVPADRPLFTHVGQFHIYGDITSATGLTSHAVLGHGGPGYGFFGCLELRGFCPKTSPDFPGVGMRYRFLYAKPGGGQLPLVGDLLCPVIVGSRLIAWDVFGTGTVQSAQTVIVAGSGATPLVTPPPSPLPPPGTPWGAPPEHRIVPDADGWVTVDPDAVGGFFALIGFDSNVAFPGGPSAPGVPAGLAVPAANQKNGADITLVFEATRVGVAGPDFTNSLSKIHINNWDEIALLDLLQFHTSGGTPCSPLSTDLDIEYTVDHELIAEWSIKVEKAGSLQQTGPSGTTPRGDADTDHHNITGWESCSYLVKLDTRRALTNGLLDDDLDTSAYKTFCK